MQREIEHVELSSESFSRLTVPQLVRTLSVGSWIAAGSLLVGTYSVGVASVKWGLIQGIFAKSEESDIKDFKSRAILEKSTYTITSGSDRLVIFVKDVSIARQVLEIEAGEDDGPRQFVQALPNSAKAIPIGGSVYELVVHDLARASLGQDIAVVSLKKRVASQPVP